MPVIEAQCASILVPHDHRHINHERLDVAGAQLLVLLTGVLVYVNFWLDRAVPGRGAVLRVMAGRS
jgi:hypothetical protein